MKKATLFFAMASVLASCAPAVTGTTMAPSTTATGCHKASDAEIAALFDRWNGSLATGDAAKVAANYKTDGVLLPTVSNVPRNTPEGIKDYFEHFLAKSPVGKIEKRHIRHGCNTAIDAGIYTFNFKDGTSVTGRYTFAYEYENGQWLIANHHSSALPQDNAKEPWDKGFEHHHH